MMRFRCCLSFFLMLALAASAHAQIFGTVRGTITDPQNNVMPDVRVALKAHSSGYTQQTTTGIDGTFTLIAVPADAYTVEVIREGFQTITQSFQLAIGGVRTLDFKMSLGAVITVVDVTSGLPIGNPDASSPPITVDEAGILHTPGADRAASIAFITDFVPGAFLLHDHLHIRGGHQVSWLIDGVPVPNTNLSSNIGRQIDPKDIESVEISTGGYSSKYGDRTYGMINIVPRSGFEFEGREFELTTGYGSLNQTNNQLSFGGHGDRFAYYGSVGGNRTDLGLEPPEKEVIHSNGNGQSGFTSLTYNLSPADQLRLTSSFRRDHYWVPNTAFDQARGIRDVNDEKDTFSTFSWVRTLAKSALLTVSPFYHYNRAQYQGGPNDPLITTDDRTSKYVGSQVNVSVFKGAHNFSTGGYFFHQSDDREFGLFLNDGSNSSAVEAQKLGGNLWTAFAEEQFKPVRWLTLNSGLRLTHYSATITENAANPRIGATLTIPKLGWILRGFWGSYYQAPPLSALSGPVLEFAVSEGFGYLPLKGERDQQREFGLTIPIKRWEFSVAHFRTNAENFSDHEVLGNSNIALPLSIQTTRSRGTELRIHSPEYKRLHFHLAYANMIVLGRGGITAGMTDFTAPPDGNFYIDHDQRHTFTSGADIRLPRRFWLNANVVAGSGFLDGDGPQHLPAHATLDIAAGKALNSRASVTFTVLNLTNERHLLGRDSSFAGTHYNDPRQFTVQFRYRFHL